MWYVNQDCKLCYFSHVQLFETAWTAAHQAPLSVGFSRQEYWSGCHRLLRLTRYLSYCLVTQSCWTLCSPADCSLPGSPVLGISQAIILEWVAISFCNAWQWKVKVKSLIRVQLLVTSWTVAQQAPPSMRFSRQEYWSGCHRLLPLLTGMTKKEVKIRKVTTIH